MKLFYLKKHRSNADLMAIKDALARLPDDKAWLVEIKEKRGTRSVQQNRYLWMIYRLIIEQGGEAMGGWTAEDLHEFFLGQHFGWEVFELFGKKRQRPIRRSSDLNKMEFVDFVNSIQIFMAQHGVVIPDPDPELAAA